MDINEYPSILSTFLSNSSFNLSTDTISPVISDQTISPCNTFKYFPSWSSIAGIFNKLLKNVSISDLEYVLSISAFKAKPLTTSSYEA